MRSAPRAADAAAVLVLLLWACTPATGPSGIVVRDGLGRSVRVPFVVRRMVSLAPSVTETIEALGLGDRLVGVSDFCVVPASRAGLKRVGGLLNPDLETIRSLHPDLLVGTTSGNDPGLDRQATALGLPLYILQAGNVDDVLAGIRGLAQALGEPDRGTQLATRLATRLDAVGRRVAGRPRPRTLFIIWGEPLVVPGSGAFLTDAIRRAGGESVTDGITTAHMAYSVEAAVASAPEIILTTRDNAAMAEHLATDPVWSSVPAVRAGRIFVVGDAVVRPGPGVVDGIEEMAGRLHPEAFSSTPAGGIP